MQVTENELRVHAQLREANAEAWADYEASTTGEWIDRADFDNGWDAALTYAVIRLTDEQVKLLRARWMKVALSDGVA